MSSLGDPRKNYTQLMREQMLVHQKRASKLQAELDAAERQLRNMAHDNERLRREVARLQSAGMVNG